MIPECMIPSSMYSDYEMLSPDEFLEKYEEATR